MIKEEQILEFDELIKKLFSFDRGHVFRGQRDARWSLETTLERAVASVPDFQHAADFAETAVKDVLKSRIHHYIHRDDVPQSNLGWLSIAQHHGAPSRLLDFTEYPLVALYFATRNLTATSPAFAIWVLNFRNLNADCEDLIDGGKIDDDPDRFFDLCEAANKSAVGLWVGEPRKVNLRLERQGGTFLIPTSSGLKIHEGFSEVKKRREIGLSKLKISTRMLPEILGYLRKAGISGSRLFDGVDGLASEISDEIMRITMTTKGAGS